MSKANTQSKIDDLDDILGDLDEIIESAQEELVVESAIIEQSEDVANIVAGSEGIDADESLIEMLEIEEESAAEKAASADAETIAITVETQAVKVTATRKSIPVGTKPSIAIATIMSGKPILLETADAAEFTADKDAYEKKALAMLETFDTAPKKVGEKLINCFKWLNGSVGLSRYTRDAIKLLFDKGEATTKMLENFYVDMPLGISTARSQTGQMKHVLPLLGIATLTGDKLKLNNESTLVQFFKSTELPAK